ncbi:MAG TPA: transglycosylase SLT domain-containing protein [Bryobacteraceae bacterium]|nr:transglycosylase SLT domain-containing protein [Bryobacteraceae bacterium]
MRLAVLFFLSLAPLGQAGSSEYFVPSHRVAGIGAARKGLSDDLLDVRTDRMIQTQTFSIMRDPQAVAGARRITGSASLQALFRSAAARTGLPQSLLEAIAYLESWGDARAESPAGPRGIMQISEGTARIMGLRVVHARRYRTTRERVLVKRRGRKPVYRTVRHRTPYYVTVRDDRLSPSRAIPAAARYLAGLEEKFGGRDWAIFAYHCGEGCVAAMQDITRRADGIPKNKMSVARMFFSCSPAWNRELYEAVQQQMERDYSPTYWFRVKRAEQLLAMYRTDRSAFLELAQEYRSQFSTEQRAPHRLSVWLKRADLLYRTPGDLRDATGTTLAKALLRPEYFNYSLHTDGRDSIAAQDLSDQPYFLQASPSALGALTYIAFATRRLFDELNPKGEHWVPLEVSSLVEPQEYIQRIRSDSGDSEALAHSSGQVFDIDYANLPRGELESLRFVLSDLGWDGYIGFVSEGVQNLHIGCAPSERDFFTSVFREATGGDSNDVGGDQRTGISQRPHVGELQDRPLPAASFAAHHSDR